MRPAANATWFEFASNYEGFSVLSFSGHEEVNKPFAFSIELVSHSAEVDIQSLLGTKACLSISDRSGGTRLVHGFIRSMEQAETGNEFTHYRCLLTPRLSFLDDMRDHRIFQNLSVVEIIEMILGEQAVEHSFKLFYEYEPREYCTQYAETSLHFITRLCEEEGIYFYFEHTKDSHTLCFCDREGGPAIAGESDIRFFSGSGGLPESAVISKASLRREVSSNAVAYRDWNFAKPRLSLEVAESEPDSALAPRPDGMLLEQYRYPHLYELREPGSRYAGLQLMRQLVFSWQLRAESDVSRFLPSYTFSITDHPRDDVNAKWWVVSVEHSGEQPGVLEHEAPEHGVLRYSSLVTAIPEKTRFVPSLDHPRPCLDFCQTAIVTGPEGEEIFTDKYGRVKVQFPWDREGEFNENTSCWIRVSQDWAGTMYGTMAIPRIGHEVVVTFLDGNPDRPLITGRVYHGLNMPPYELPAHKTRTVFKSMSTPGREGESRGFNELRIEDKAGMEEIYGHAEKDVNIHVKNDWKEHILHDRHRTVDNFTYTETKGETHEKLHGPRKTELFANDNLTIHGDREFATDGKHLILAGEEFHFDVGTKVVLEAGAELTLKAGGSFITFGGGGVNADGAMIYLNSGGSPGSGTPAKPLVGTPKCVEFFALTDEAGEPAANIQYRLTAASGKMVAGITGKDGKTQLITTDSPESVELEIILDGLTPYSK